MPDLSKCLIAAWVWLVSLSGAAALIATFMGQGVPRRVAAAAILLLAMFKARIILARYLDLNQAPDWLSGFAWVTGVWAVVILGLYLV